MSRVGDQQVELLRALARHGVEFVVVGDVGAQVHGWLGATADLDIEEGLIVVAAPEDILRSKQAAGREKDRAALAQMRRDFLEAGALERSPRPEPGGSFG